MNPEVPRTEAALAQQRPTQAEMDTAARVVWWLYAHARLFPDQYPEQTGLSLATTDVLVGVANLCDVDVEMLVTTYAEQGGEESLCMC